MSRVTYQLSVCSVVLIGLCGCGGLDRDDAAEIIEEGLFPSLRAVEVEAPRSQIEYSMGLGQYGSWSPGNCDERTYGWTSTDFASVFECVRELERIGVVERVLTGESGLLPLPEDNSDEEVADLSSLTVQSILASAPERRDRRRLYLATLPERPFDKPTCERFQQAGSGATSFRVWVPSGRFDGVTGISGEGEERVVEFEYHHDLSAFGQVATACRAELPDTAVRTARSTLRKFDDGWRIESTEWNK